MSINIQRLGILEELPRKVTVDMDNITIRDMIFELTKRFGMFISETLIDQGELREGLCILLNGRSIGSLQGLSTKLKAEDDVFITIVINGG